MKYIDLETFEIIDRVIPIFEVDEAIAEAILLLNKKGYKTLFCCAGHYVDSPIVMERYSKKNYSLAIMKDFFATGHMRPVKEDDKYYYSECCQQVLTNCYVCFVEDIKLPFVPLGFVQEGNVISCRIDFFHDFLTDKKKTKKEIKAEFKTANENLAKWAKELPCLS